MSAGAPTPIDPPKTGVIGHILNLIEWAGNKLPDPAMLFLLALFITWGFSKALADVNFTEIDPKSRVVQSKDPDAKPPEGKPIVIKDQLTGDALVKFLTNMVKNFVEFPPLGIVLVALLGVGVAEHTGFVNAAIRALLNITPKMLLTPMLLLVSIVSHSAGDTGYVLVIPLGGVIFAAAGRHPLAGIVCAFAGVSGGFSANFLPSGLDPLLQGLTQGGAQILDKNIQVNPLCNYYFTAISSLLIIGVGWFITDRIIEPRLSKTPVDGDATDAPKLEALTTREKAGLVVSLLVVLAGAAAMTIFALQPDSPFNDKALTPFHVKMPNIAPNSTEPVTLTLNPKNNKLPLMEAIVPFIFLFFLIPGIVYGYVAGTVKNHRDIVKGMSKAMSTMGYYLVMVFFAAQFIYAFNESNLGLLLAVKGANFLKEMDLSGPVTLIGIILLASIVNLLIGSASAKWALLAPIFVPMLMELNFAPELTQAAYRVGDSSTNIITPLMPYFPLIVVYAQRYVKSTGIGTMISLMIPYSLFFMITWTILLIVLWQLGIPLGIGGRYTLTPVG